ncbi:TPA: XRE family transcriptional regulator [Streptococcus suis]
MFSERRLKEKRLELGYSQSSLAKQLGITRTAYHKWEEGKSIPNKKNLAALAEIFGVEEVYFNSDYHIISTYLQLNNKNQVKAENYLDTLLEKQIEDERLQNVVPLFPLPVLKDVPLSAGLGENYYDEYESEIVYADREYQFDIAAFIKGDSMSPRYLDGEVALINENGFDYSGAVYAIYLNGQTFIKKVYKETDHYRIVSINDEYGDKYAYEEDDFRIVGKVIGHFMPIVGD